MAALGSQTIASSYEQLLHTDTDGGGNGNTLVTIKDGDNGTTFGIKLATNKVEVIPGSNDANAFEVSQADGTAVFTVNTSSPAFTLTGDATLGNSSSSALVTIKTTGSSNHAGLSLEAPASGTGDPYINFKQGSGDGSANNMNYQLVHDTSEGYFKFRSADSDGSSTDADIWRVVDGTDDFRIPTGRIAIGDVAPTAPLHIKAAPINTSGARSAQLYIEDTTAFGSTQNSGIQFRQEWQSGSTTSTSAIVGTRTSTSSGNYGGALIFQTRANGGDLADNMIIQDDGDVGIGTTSPAVELDVHGSSEIVAGFGRADDANAYVSVRTDNVQNKICGYSFNRKTSTPTGVGSTDTLAYIHSNVKNSTGATNAAGDLQFITNSGGSLGTRMSINKGGGISITGDFHDSSTSDPGNYQIAFGGDSTSAPRWGFRVSTSSNDEDLHLDRNLSGTSTPCMTWDKNNGNVGIGTTSPSQTLDVESNANTYVQEIRNEHGSTPYGLIINFGSADPNTTNYPFIAGSATGTDRFKIYSDGSYSDISDEREKENIKDTESQLANINKLEIKNYNRINDKSKGDHIGVIAQQIEPIYPHLVRTSDDEQKTKMVYKIGLIAPLIKAVQELSAQNDALTARIEALESA